MSSSKRTERDARQSSNQESGSGGGFRTFWQKSDDSNNQPGALTFVEQDASSKKKGSRIRRIFKSASSPSTTESVDEDSGPSTAQKRRQQVYQAQKRHRNRKAEYVKSLEEEIARLQHLDALINSEKNELAHQNQAMRQFLASQSLEAHLESISFHSATTATESLSALGGAPLDIRFDPIIGHERVYMDLDDLPASEMAWTSESSSQAEAARAMRQHAPVKGDSWAALDFILALEWPCKDHVHHPAIHPDPESPAASDEFTGHALTTTAAVYQSALPPPLDPSSAAAATFAGSSRSATQSSISASTAAAATAASVTAAAVTSNIPEPERRWHLPHSEIDKYGPTYYGGSSSDLHHELLPPQPPPSSQPLLLDHHDAEYSRYHWTANPDHDRRLVMLSEKLDLDDDQMTPAQAYSAIREAVPADAYLRPTLDAIKAPLGGLVHCTGIGAILPADMFWQQLDIALQSVRSARPDLASIEPGAAVTAAE